MDYNNNTRREIGSDNIYTMASPLNSPLPETSRKYVENMIDTNDSISYDHHGFAILERHIDWPRDVCRKVHRGGLHSRQMDTLEDLVNTWDDATSRSSVKLQNFIKRGIPNGFRSRLWKKFLEVDTLNAWTTFVYSREVVRVREQLVELGISEYSLAVDSVSFLSDSERHEADAGVTHGNHGCRQGQQISRAALRHIILDLERTYPSHQMYMGDTAAAKEGRAALFRVLAVYARFNTRVEYCQGMSSIAGLLLMHLDEEDAFWCLVSLLERHKYLVGYFDHQMYRLHRHSAVFEKLLKSHQPRLHSHLRVCGVDPLMYLTPWFMCVFTSWTCWDSVLAIWDLLLLEGNVTLFRVGLAVLDLMAAELMAETELSGLLPALLNIPAHICDFDKFVPHLLTIQLDNGEINSILSSIEAEDRGGVLAGGRSLGSHGQSHGQPMGLQSLENGGPMSPVLQAKLTSKANTPESSGLIRKFSALLNPGPVKRGRVLGMAPGLRRSSRKGSQRGRRPRGAQGNRQAEAADPNTLTKMGGLKNFVRRKMGRNSADNGVTVGGGDDQIPAAELETTNSVSGSCSLETGSTDDPQREELDSGSGKSDAESARTAGRRSVTRRVGEACREHPLAEVLAAGSPQLAVSPTLVRHLRQGCDSPVLARRVMLAEALRNSPQSVAGTNNRSDAEKSKSEPRRSGGGRKVAHKPLSHSEKRKSPRKTRRSLNLTDTPKTALRSSSANTKADDGKENVGGSGRKRKLLGENCDIDREECNVLPAGGSCDMVMTRSARKRRGCFSAQGVRLRCGTDVVGTPDRISQPATESPAKRHRGIWALTSDSVNSIWSSPMRRRHDSDTLLDGTAATRY